MKTDEKNILEAMLIVNESLEKPIVSDLVYTNETAPIFVKNIINEQIPKWKDSREISIKKTHLSGFFWGWVSSGFITSKRYYEIERDFNIAISNRIQELLK